MREFVVGGAGLGSGKGKQQWLPLQTHEGAVINLWTVFQHIQSNNTAI